MRVASFQIILRLVGRLGLGLGLGSGLEMVRTPRRGWLGSAPRIMGRLGSRVWVSVSFQIFALTAGVMTYVRREIVRRGNVRRNIPEAGNVHGNVLHLMNY